MPARLLLVSSNLAGTALRAAVKRIAAGATRAAIVTTAELRPVERRRNAALARLDLCAAGIAHLENFDLDRRPGDELAAFDLVYLAGGNPYYLLKRARETGADAVLERLSECGVPILGANAGALLLGPSLRHLRFFDASVADLGWGTRAALSLVPFTVLPHANRWRARFADYEQRLSLACAACGCQIVELDDGDGLLLDDRQVACLGETWPALPARPTVTAA